MEINELKTSTGPSTDSDGNVLQDTSHQDMLDRLEDRRKGFLSIQNIEVPVTLDVLQAQLKPWALYNFGDRQSYEPLLGMIEEIGEISNGFVQTCPEDTPEDVQALLIIMALFGKLTHHHLKRMQNIRGSSEEHNIAIEKWTKLFSNATDGLYYDDIDTVVNLKNQEEVLPQVKDTVEDGLADTLVYAADFANAMQVDLAQELNDCWKKVRQRDWVAKRMESAKKE